MYCKYHKDYLCTFTKGIHDEIKFIEYLLFTFCCENIQTLLSGFTGKRMYKFNIAVNLKDILYGYIKHFEIL